MEPLLYYTDLIAFNRTMVVFSILAVFYEEVSKRSVPLENSIPI